MASALPFKVTQLETPQEDIIKDMIRIYQEAYQKDVLVQLNLKHIMSNFMDQMAKTIAGRVLKPECEYFIAREWSSGKIVGWLALAFQRPNGKKISEEHVLLLQYALLPDIVVKTQDHGIGTDGIKTLANAMLKEFKSARENYLPDGHCILSTLVVDPEYQNKGVASALLSKAIHFTEIFSFPIWVQAPEACQSLFERHAFNEVGQYLLDLNEHVPKAVGKGKAKAKDVSSLGRYVFKFMVRQEPMESAVGAYKSSKIYAEEEEAARARERGILGRISRMFSGAEARPETTEPVLGEEEQSPSEEITTDPGRAEADASTPLLADSSSKSGQKSRSKGKVARNDHPETN